MFSIVSLFWHFIHCFIVLDVTVPKCAFEHPRLNKSGHCPQAFSLLLISTGRKAGYAGLMGVSANPKQVWIITPHTMFASQGKVTNPAWSAVFLTDGTNTISWQLLARVVFWNWRCLFLCYTALLHLAVKVDPTPNLNLIKPGKCSRYCEEMKLNLDSLSSKPKQPCASLWLQDQSNSFAKFAKSAQKPKRIRYCGQWTSQKGRP